MSNRFFKGIFKKKISLSGLGKYCYVSLRSKQVDVLIATLVNQ